MKKNKLFFLVFIFISCLLALTIVQNPGTIDRLSGLLQFAIRPRLIYTYLTQPAFRELMHLLAEDYLHSFPAVWDQAQGVYLSKQAYKPLTMEGRQSYGHRPSARIVYFNTGFNNTRRNFAVPESPRLLKVLSQLDTRVYGTAQISAQGFRRSGFEIAQNCSKHIFFAGDSFTEGLFVNDDEVFVSLYGKELNQRLNKPICVTNGGVNGYSLFEESFTARDYYARHSFDILYLIVYPNDIFTDGFALLLGNVEGIDEHWNQYFQQLSNLAAFCRERNITLILVTIPPKEQLAMPESRVRYQEILQKYCQSLNIHFWDPFEEFKQRTWNELYLDWDPHLNASGHRILAHFLAQKTLTSKELSL